MKVDVQAGESSSPRCAKNRALCKELFMLCDLTDRKKKKVRKIIRWIILMEQSWVELCKYKLEYLVLAISRELH